MLVNILKLIPMLIAAILCLLAIENKTYYVKAARLIAKSVEALKKG